MNQGVKTEYKDKRTHHIHIYQQGDEQIERHLDFRGNLRINSKLKNEYGVLKEKLSKQFPYDMDLYIKGKCNLVSKIEDKALKTGFKIHNSSKLNCYSRKGEISAQGDRLSFTEQLGRITAETVFKFDQYKCQVVE